MSMQRRHVLATTGLALAGAFAGCMGDTSPSDSNDGDENGEHADDESSLEEHFTPVPTDQHDPLEIPDVRNRFDLIADPENGLQGAISPLFVRLDNGLEMRLRAVADADRDSPLTLAATATNPEPVPVYAQTRHMSIFSVPTSTNPTPYADRSPPDSSSLAIHATPASDLITEDPPIRRSDEGHWVETARRHASEFPDVVKFEPGDTLYAEFSVVYLTEDREPHPGKFDYSGPTAGFSLTLWEIDHPGPIGSSTFVDEAVPDLPSSEDGTEWYHEADATSETYLHPSAEHLDTPGKITVTYVNHSSESATGNPHGWGLWKLVEGQWYHVAPTALTLPAMWLPPGDTHTLERQLFNGPGLDRGDGSQSGVGFLGPGTYALEMHMSTDGARPAALLKISGEPIELTPSEDVRIADETDDALILVDEEWEDTDERDRAELVLTRSRKEPDERMIVEQVMRTMFSGLRNVLAYRDAADTVVLRTHRSRTWMYAQENGTWQIEYDDEVFAIEAQG